MVWRVLFDSTTKKPGWRVLRRDEQVQGMREWTVRGNAGACGLDDEGGELDAGEVKGKGLDEMIRRQSRAVKGRVRDACTRCEMGTKEGTQGFFVVGFVRGEEEGLLDSVSLVEEDREEGGYEKAESMDGEEEWDGISDT